MSDRPPDKTKGRHGINPAAPQSGSRDGGTRGNITTTALATVADQIQTEHKAAQRCASEAVAHAIRAGELLIEAKAALPHGAFGAWLAANVEFSDRTARGYMQLRAAVANGLRRRRL